ncbi:FAD binding domain-containing protein [Artemisia annua]|uniref:FAD binding domain-containing protein n=1 Tax=Artemisia annua TaxID=35608 RepID=A0A2U1L9Y6_ARTAN|nr:FAD binding domain-containing protein [Artemisia annua]
MPNTPLERAYLLKFKVFAGCAGKIDMWCLDLRQNKITNLPNYSVPIEPVARSDPALTLINEKQLLGGSLRLYGAAILHYKTRSPSAIVRSVNFKVYYSRLQPIHDYIGGIRMIILFCIFGELELIQWTQGVFKSRKYRETLESKRDVKKEGKVARRTMKPSIEHMRGSHIDQGVSRWWDPPVVPMQLGSSILNKIIRRTKEVRKDLQSIMWVYVRIMRSTTSFIQLQDKGLPITPTKARENAFLITEAVRDDGGPHASSVK